MSENPSKKEGKNGKHVGTWKLISFEVRSSRGNVMYPLGKDPYGMLMFDSIGNMSALAMRRDRPKFASNDSMKGTPEEIKAAFEGLIAYCGTYEVNEEKRINTHHIEGSWFPNLVGTDQVRFFEYSNDQLRLYTPPIPAGDEQVTINAIYNKKVRNG